MPSPPMKRGSKQAAPTPLQFGLRPVSSIIIQITSIFLIIQGSHCKQLLKFASIIHTSAKSLTFGGVTIKKASLRFPIFRLDLGTLNWACYIFQKAFATTVVACHTLWLDRRSWFASWTCFGSTCPCFHHPQ